MSKKIGVFYGSSTCYTEIVAEKIAEILGTENVELLNIAHTPLDHALAYQYLIFGIPTWDFGELQEDWDENWDDLDGLNLTGKYAAIFGLGDQVGYAKWFQDGLGYLYFKLKSQGATMIGHWPNQDYDFEDSQGLTDDKSHFLGLPLDEENQPELSEQRIRSWLIQLTQEMQLN